MWTPQVMGNVILVGLGATAVLDAWLAVISRLGVRTQRWALVGRWVGHWRHGRFRHAAIADAAPVAGETALGVAMHYATGLAFAGGLVLLAGVDWLRVPTVLPALGFGIVTVLFPLLVMQPALGYGLASSRTPTPVRNVLRSLANHAVFGVGLYLSARIAAPFFHV